MMDTSRTYQSLLLAYAAGALDEAQSLIVASHIAMSERAREYVRSYETIGGTIIERHCKPVAMRPSALDCVLAEIEKRRAPTQAKPAHCCKSFTGGCDLPEPLSQKLEEQENLRWHEIAQGLQAYELMLRCKQSHSKFMKMAPGLRNDLRVPQPPRTRIEITLVLDGGFEDDSGHYMRGDMVIFEQSAKAHHMACDKKGCLSLVVTSAPLELHGIESLIRTFIKF